MFKLVALLIIVVIAVILFLASIKPDTFRVERSISIHATPEKVFPHINDLRSWADWSAWEKLDATMKKTYSASTVGKGATYEWQGNKKVGHGRMEITESLAPEKIVIKLDFFVPFEAHNLTELSLRNEGGQSYVTWVMTGPSPFVSKLMGVFFSMDQMIGKDFESGLSNLKTIAEK